MMRPFLAVFLVLFFICGVALAGAKEHFINGREYYEEGRYAAAIEEFEKAYVLDALPAFLYNIAQAYEKLGKLRLSVEYLNRFLEEDEKKNETEAIKSKIANLEARIRKTGITVTSPEEGATIYVDDKEMGTTPVDTIIPLSEGMHAVRIIKPGFEPFTMTVGVSTGYSVPVYAKLARAEKEDVVTAPAPTPPEPPANIDSEEVDERSEEASSGSQTEKKETGDDETFLKNDEKGLEPLDIVPWALAGVGAAVAVGGFAGVGTVAMVNNDESLAHVADGVGWPGVAVAAGGAIWGIVRLLKKRKESRGAMVSPLVDEHRLGVAAAVEF